MPSSSDDESTRVLAELAKAAERNEARLRKRADAALSPHALAKRTLMAQAHQMSLQNRQHRHSCMAVAGHLVHRWDTAAVADWLRGTCLPLMQAAVAPSGTPNDKRRPLRSPINNSSRPARTRTASPERQRRKLLAQYSEPLSSAVQAHEVSDRKWYLLVLCRPMK